MGFTNGAIDMFRYILQSNNHYLPDRESFEKNKRNLAYKSFFVCILVGIASSYMLGRPNCEDVEFASQTCDQYDYNSEFTPSAIQRVGVFTTFFTYSLIVTIVGINKAKDEFFKNEKNSLEKNDVIP